MPVRFGLDVLCLNVCDARVFTIRAATVHASNEDNQRTYTEVSAFFVLLCVCRSASISKTVSFEDSDFPQSITS